MQNLVRGRGRRVSLGAKDGVGGGGVGAGVVLVPDAQHEDAHAGLAACGLRVGLGVDDGAGGDVTVETMVRRGVSSSSLSRPAKRLAWAKDFFLSFMTSAISGNSSGLSTTVGTIFFRFSRSIMQLPGAKR